MSADKWTVHAQASANNWVILKDNNWVAAIQFNGELMEAKQQELVNVMTAGRELLNALRYLVATIRGRRTGKARIRRTSSREGAEGAASQGQQTHVSTKE